MATSKINNPRISDIDKLISTLDRTGNGVRLTTSDGTTISFEYDSNKLYVNAKVNGVWKGSKIITQW